MIPTNNKIIVRVDMAQKNAMSIGGVEVRCANNYEVNYRVKSPVIAVVVDGNNTLRPGDVIICHHNHFYYPSPYHLQDDLYSIPFNKTIFGKLDINGDLMPVCGNILCEKIPIKTTLPLPPEQRKFYTNRGIVINGGKTGYNKGDIVFTRPSAPYDIVYIFDGIQKTVTKISEDMVCAVLEYNISEK